MKKLALVMIVALVGCETNPPEYKNTGYTAGFGDIKEYTIDGCKYIGKLNGKDSDFLTHKGNCNNPIHKIKDLENKD